MKYLFLLAVLLPVILGAPQERFLFNLKQVVDQVETFAHSGMGQSACVTACGSGLAATGYGALLTPLCPQACTDRQEWNKRVRIEQVEICSLRKIEQEERRRQERGN